MTALWDIASCSLDAVDRRFRGAYCFHHQSDEMGIVLMMEALRIYETSVYYNETTRREISEGYPLHTRRRENLISHKIRLVLDNSAPGT
jgi:hypothetical protein